MSVDNSAKDLSVKGRREWSSHKSGIFKGTCDTQKFKKHHSRRMLKEIQTGSQTGETRLKTSDFLLYPALGESSRSLHRRHFPAKL